MKEICCIFISVVRAATGELHFFAHFLALNQGVNYEQAMQIYRSMYPTHSPVLVSKQNVLFAKMFCENFNEKCQSVAHFMKLEQEQQTALQMLSNQHLQSQLQANNSFHGLNLIPLYFKYIDGQILFSTANIGQYWGYTVAIRYCLLLQKMFSAETVQSTSNDPLNNLTLNENGCTNN